jgi:metacaspase-1
MAKGLALTIGLNAVDPRHYAGWSGRLQACEADARDMADIARARKFTVQRLLTRRATRRAVLAGIARAAAALRSGDIFLLTYSGHGGQVPDRNHDEPDLQDETWCLYDGELIDDEINQALGRFKAGVRVLVLSDSCHSGTVTKAMFYAARGAVAGAAAPGASGAERIRYRNMPREVALRTYRAHRAMYDKLQDAIKGDPRAAVRAAVILISGCQDNQLSQDGDFNGLFTANLLRVWKEGQFKGTYRTFHSAIVRNMPPDQTPRLFTIGASAGAFERQRPFTV